MLCYTVEILRSGLGRSRCHPRNYQGYVIGFSTKDILPSNVLKSSVGSSVSRIRRAVPAAGRGRPPARDANKAFQFMVGHN